MFYVFICFANVLCMYQEEWQVCGRCLEIMIIKSSKFTTVGKHNKPRSLQSWCVSLLEQILIDSQSNNKKSHLATLLFEAKIRAEVKRFPKCLFVLMALWTFFK